MAIEIEKKYRLTAKWFDEIAASLEEFNAEYRGEVFEENTLYVNDEIIAQGGVVRIRRTDTRATLAFKQRQASNFDAKQHLEYESDVADADAVASILKMLHLRPMMVYEKKRRTYKLRSVELVLDELPFGLFMEIEGSITAIKEVEMLLGAEELEVERETYPKLTAKLGVLNGDIVEARFT